MIVSVNHNNLSFKLLYKINPDLIVVNFRLNHGLKVDSLMDDFFSSLIDSLDNFINHYDNSPSGLINDFSYGSFVDFSNQLDLGFINKNHKFINDNPDYDLDSVIDDSDFDSLIDDSDLLTDLLNPSDVNNTDYPVDFLDDLSNKANYKLLVLNSYANLFMKDVKSIYDISDLRKLGKKLTIAYIIF